MFCTWGDFFRCSIAIEHFQIQSKLPDPGTFSAQTFKHLNIDKSLPGTFLAKKLNIAKLKKVY